MKPEEKPADPIKLLFRVENLIEKEDGLSAASLCRTCLEAGLREISRQKFPNVDIENEKRFRGPGSFNNFLLKNNEISEKEHEEIKWILGEVGHKGTHAVYETELNKALGFYQIVKNLFVKRLYPIMNLSTTDIKQIKIRYLRAEFDKFHFFSDENVLLNHLKLEEEINEIEVENANLSKLIKNFESTKLNNLLILGESGVGKTVLSSQICKKLLSSENSFIAIPFYSTEIQDYQKLNRNYPNISILLDDFDYYTSANNFIQNLKNNLPSLKNLIVTCKTHTFKQLCSSYRFLESLFSEIFYLDKHEDNALVKILNNFLNEYKLLIPENEFEIKKIIVEKAEGIPLYIRELIRELKKRDEVNGRTITLSEASQLPLGLVALICELFYSTFLEVEESIKKDRQFELKFLFSIAQLPYNRYHNIFVKFFTEELQHHLFKKDKNNLDLLVNPVDYLYTKDNVFYNFSHSIWKNILLNHRILISNVRDKQSNVSKRHLDILQNSLVFFQKQLKDLNTVMAVSIIKAFNQPAFPLPIELWTNGFENLAFLYKDMLVNYFEPIVFLEGFQNNIKNDYNEKRKEIYIEFLENIRINSSIFRKVGAYDLAKRSYKVGLRISEIVEIDLLTVDFLIALGITARLEFNEEETMKYFDKAEEIARSAGLEESLAHIYYNYANVLIQNKDINCIGFIEKATIIFERIKNNNGLVNTELSYGHYFSLIGEYEEEREHYQKGLELINENTNPILEIKLLNSLATTYMDKRSNYRKAIELLEENIKKAARLFEFREIATIKLNLSYIYTNLEDFPKAEDYCDSLLETAETSNFKDIEAKAKTLRGDIFFRRYKTQDALNMYEKAQIVCEELNLADDLIIIHRNRGRIYQLQKREKEALIEYKKSYNYLKPTLNIDMAHDTFIWLCQFVQLSYNFMELVLTSELCNQALTQWNRIPEEYREDKITISLYEKTVSICNIL